MRHRRSASANCRIDDDPGRSGQRLGACLRTVYLEHVCRDIDGGLVVHVLETPSRSSRLQEICLYSRYTLPMTLLAR